MGTVSNTGMFVSSRERKKNQTLSLYSLCPRTFLLSKQTTMFILMVITRNAISFVGINDLCLLENFLRDVLQIVNENPQGHKAKENHHNLFRVQMKGDTSGEI